MTRRVQYSSRASQQLAELYTWIADQSGYPDRAEQYVSAIVDACDNLAEFPLIGQARNDLRPGLRTLGFRRRVMIAFAVGDETVDILGIYYGGRDYEALVAGDAQ